jgi:EAL domain-containing protein (putative c-di-GMP-specific phosphodiesterase class I)
MPAASRDRCFDYRIFHHQLKRLPIDQLEIDKSFVRDVLQNADDSAIVRGIITLAHSLRLEVIAESVENEAQLHFLQALGGATACKGFT